MDGRDGALFGAERAATRWTGPAQPLPFVSTDQQYYSAPWGCSREPGSETTAKQPNMNTTRQRHNQLPKKKASNRKNETSDSSAINHCGAISPRPSALAWGNKGPHRPLTVHHPKRPETRGIMQALRPGWVGGWRDGGGRGPARLGMYRPGSWEEREGLAGCARVGGSGGTPWRQGPAEDLMLCRNGMDGMGRRAVGMGLGGSRFESKARRLTVVSW